MTAATATIPFTDTYSLNTLYSDKKSSQQLENETALEYEKSIYKIWNIEKINDLIIKNKDQIENWWKQIDNISISENYQIQKLLIEDLEKYKEFPEFSKITPFRLPTEKSEDILVPIFIAFIKSYLLKEIDAISEKVYSILENQKQIAFSRTILNNDNINTKLESTFFEIFRYQDFRVTINIPNNNQHIEKLNGKIKEWKQEIEKDIAEIKNILINFKKEIKFDNANFIEQIKNIRISMQNHIKDIDEKIKKLNEKIEIVPKILIGILTGNEKQKLLESVNKIPEEASSLKKILTSLIETKPIEKQDFEQFKRESFSTYSIVEQGKQRDKLEGACRNAFSAAFINIFTFGWGCDMTDRSEIIINYDSQLFWILLGLVNIFGTNKNSNGETVLHEVVNSIPWTQYTAGKTTEWFSSDEIDKELKRFVELVNYPMKPEKKT